MKRLTAILFMLTLAAGGLTATAQDTNSTAGRDSDPFDIIVRNNIFDQSRTGEYRRANRRQAPRIERIILSGIAAGLGDAEANFGGIGSSDRMLKVGDHVGGFELKQITPDCVKLSNGTNTFVLDMDNRRSLRRTDDGPWEGSTEQSEPPTVSTNAPDATATGTASAADAAHPGESPIERRLRLRREQEEK